MCGIVASVSNRNIVPLLVQGLQRLEYRGYDSCGVAVHRMVSGSPISQGLERTRSTARVAQLLAQVQTEDFQGLTGIAHTRWATHGAPAVANADPHFGYGPGLDAGSGVPARTATATPECTRSALLSGCTLPAATSLSMASDASTTKSKASSACTRLAASTPPTDSMSTRTPVRWV